MPDSYGNYQELDGWYGVPNYGSGYSSYLGAQAQPLSMDRIVSMVREIQQGMNRQPMGNQAVSVSPVSQMQLPGQIAANIMNTQNRLLSMPRQRWSASGANEMDANNVNHVPSQPAATAPGTPALPFQPQQSQPQSGGSGGSGSNWSPSNSTPSGSALDTYNASQYKAPTPTYTAPKTSGGYHPATGAFAGGIAGRW